MTLKQRIEFRDLLASAGLDAAKTKLIRHQGSFHGRTPWSLWVASDGRFELYQRIQVRPVLDAGHIASFVITPDGRTLFVGIWQVDGSGVVPGGTVDPLAGTDATGNLLYDLTHVSALSDHTGALIIAWPKGRRWDRRADRPGYFVEELRPQKIELPFPGYVAFTSAIDDLSHLPASWRHALSTANGVYLLVDVGDGTQYVGSAYGADGILGRCRQYVANGHGGNARLKKRGRREYVVSILEVAGSAAGWDDIVARETLWKTKLGTRAHGLNAN